MNASGLRISGIILLACTHRAKNSGDQSHENSSAHALRGQQQKDIATS